VRTHGATFFCFFVLLTSDWFFSDKNLILSDGFNVPPKRNMTRTLIERTVGLSDNWSKKWIDNSQKRSKTQQKLKKQKFISTYFSQLHTMTMHITAMYIQDLKTSHPGGIRTRDLLFWRRTRLPLCHADNSDATKTCRTNEKDRHFFAYKDANHCHQIVSHVIPV
jgi:hypothetical protein